MLILGIADNLIRLLDNDIGLHQFHVMRSLAAIAGLVAFARWRQLRLAWHNRTAVLWRGVLVGLAMYLYFAALAFMPIGTVVAGLFTAPIFVVIISSVGFGHRLRAAHALAVALGFSGMVCITLPTDGGFSPMLPMPILAGFFYALANVIAREYCERESTVTLSISVFAALGLLGSVSLVLWNTVAPSLPPGTPSFIALGWQTPSSTATALTLFHALCASLAIGLLTFAYQRGLPTRVAVLEYTLLVFAAIFAWLFWQELPTKLAVAGMLLIALSGVIITYQAPEPPTQ